MVRSYIASLPLPAGATQALSAGSESESAAFGRRSSIALLIPTIRALAKTE